MFAFLCFVGLSTFSTNAQLNTFIETKVNALVKQMTFEAKTMPCGPSQLILKLLMTLSI